MPEREPDFHEFSLHSSLFKGHTDWYFCYLKAEKIAAALSVIAASAGGEMLRDLAQRAGALPEAVALYAAGELSQEAALADVFILRSAVRFAAASGALEPKNGAIIAEEYERVARKLGALGKPSPFVSPEDFALPTLSAPASHAARLHALPLKDMPAGSKGHLKRLASTTHQERSARILAFIKKAGGASIKDIARAIKDCGEKTIQRELALLIEQGLVRKEGERRWSVYYARE